MKSRRSRLAVAGVLALSVTVGLSAGAAQAKKKKAKIGGTVNVTKTVNAPIGSNPAPVPDAGPTTFGVLDSTIKVGGKKFKGTKIRDVNVTVQTAGTSGASAADNLLARLTAPNGATTQLFFALAGHSIGPVTLDDESVNFLFPTAPPAPAATALVSPYQGTAQPSCFAVQFSPCVLSAMDNGGVTGTWTLSVYDFSVNETSNLVSWQLVVAAGKPYKT